MRYHHPVPLGQELRIRAWQASSSHGLHRARAEISLAGRVLARAEGKFLPPGDQRPKPKQRVPDEAGAGPRSVQ